MRKCRSIACFLVTCCLLSRLVFSISAYAETIPLPSVSAQAAVVLEAESGKVIFSRAASQRLPMASTTKLVTALTALSLASPETVITVPREAVGVEGSSVYLTEGEALTLEQLLYALLLESANDAAVAIAIGVAGSVLAFAEQMNAQAATLGLCDTHFTNPHGLDDEEHYTTAYELAALTRLALQNDLLAKIVATRKTTIPSATSGGERLLINHNKLLRLYEGCIGVKTGFTKRSGRCLVSAAEKDGVTLIAVTLNAPNDWNDHAQMLDYGFSLYESVVLCESGDFLFPLSVVGGDEPYVMVVNSDGISLPLPKKRGPIVVTVEASRFAYAPLAEGETLGQAVFRCDTDGDGRTEIIASTSLDTCYGVLRDPPKKSFWSWLLSIFF